MRPENPHLGTAATPPVDLARVRYGVYLQPSPEMAAVALDAMRIANDVYGFQAATAYPPHITLLGSVPVLTDEPAFISAIDGELARHRAVRIHNGGLHAEIRNGIGYDCNHDPTGEVNRELHRLWSGLSAATREHRGYVESDWAAAKRRGDEEAGLFTAHLTIVGHDGEDNPDLVPDVRRFLEALDLHGPDSWIADTVTLYRLHSENWPKRYWHTLQWVPLRSWRLDL